MPVALFGCLGVGFLLAGGVVWGVAVVGGGVGVGGWWWVGFGGGGGVPVMEDRADSCLGRGGVVVPAAMEES